MNRYLLSAAIVLALACGIYAALTLFSGDGAGAPLPARSGPAGGSAGPEADGDRSAGPELAAGAAPQPSTQPARPVDSKATEEPDTAHVAAPTAPAAEAALPDRAERRDEPGRAPDSPVVDHRSPLERRFQKMADRWATESRDSAWAERKESRIIGLFRDRDVEWLVAGLDCRSTICKLQIRIRDSKDFYRLIGLPGLEQEIGPEVVTQPEGPDDDRRIVSYFARDGFTVVELTGEQ